MKGRQVPGEGATCCGDARGGGGARVKGQCSLQVLGEAAAGAWPLVLPQDDHLLALLLL